MSRSVWDSKPEVSEAAVQGLAHNMKSLRMLVNKYNKIVWVCGGATTAVFLMCVPGSVFGCTAGLGIPGPMSFRAPYDLGQV